MQVGSAIATHLFPIVGTEGTVAIRIVFSAIILGMAARGQLHSYKQLFLSNWKLLLPFGLCITLMNFCFYKAIELIPLGAAVAIGFIGPLSVAAMTSRRIIHFVWITLAAIGILLFSPLSGADLNPIGVGYELIAAIGWGSFVVLSGSVGKRVPGNNGLTIAMMIAAITMLPFFMPIVNQLLHPRVFLIGLGVALLATSIPFTLEYHALNRIPPRNYGVLISVEPAIAAIVGAILLEDYLGFQIIVAIIFVIVAAIGMALSKS